MKTIPAVLLALLLALPAGAAERYEVDANVVKGGLVFTGALVAGLGASFLHRARTDKKTSGLHAGWSSQAYSIAAASSGSEAAAWGEYGDRLQRSSARLRRRSTTYRKLAVVAFAVAVLPVGAVFSVSSEGFGVRKSWRF